MLAEVRRDVQDVQHGREEAEAVESERGDGARQERQFGGCQFQGQQPMFCPE